MDATQRPAFTILVVDDDHEMAAVVREILAPLGYAVRHATSGAAAHAVLDTAVPDLILLDLSLPDVDGLVLCGDLKARAAVPIIVCSASDRERDSVLSLRLGAEDFIAKPFRTADFEARVTAVLHRHAERSRATPHPEAAPADPQCDGVTRAVGPLAVDHGRRQATIGGHLLPLTATEYRLLAMLVERVDHVVSRQELAHAIWDHYDAALGRSLDVHVSHLRAKLARAGTGTESPPTIQVARGFGFRLVPAPRSIARLPRRPEVTRAAAR